MSTFGITAASQGLAPTEPERMPQFIQFQWNGVNLGGPDADTVNFVGAGFTVTRGGVGVDDDTVTVELA